MPQWIHDRAMSLKKDMAKTYGPEKAEQVAFAVATQQAHRLGKSPKTFKSKVTGRRERFGTTQARRVAMAKFDRPKREYQKTAGVYPFVGPRKEGDPWYRAMPGVVPMAMVGSITAGNIASLLGKKRPVVSASALFGGLSAGTAVHLRHQHDERALAKEKTAADFGSFSEELCDIMGRNTLVELPPQDILEGEGNALDPTAVASFSEEVGSIVDSKMKEAMATPAQLLRRAQQVGRAPKLRGMGVKIKDISAPVHKV